MALLIAGCAERAQSEALPDPGDCVWIAGRWLLEELDPNCDDGACTFYQDKCSVRHVCLTSNRTTQRVGTLVGNRYEFGGGCRATFIGDTVTGTCSVPTASCRFRGSRAN
jgi:hypothetical protein